MISAEAARTMARYNAWRNREIAGWAAPLADEERRRDRGLFWGSIMGTLNHLLWADAMWMHRLTGSDAPEAALADSPRFHDQWEALTSARRVMDHAILTWTAGLQDRDLEGELTWFSQAAGREMTDPRWRMTLHMFNHQTHHRGQLHAVATALGVKPGDTDLMLMPEPK